MQINISDIEVRTRVRPLKDTQVAALVDSIAEVGLLNPITITPKVRFRHGQPEDAYELVAGAHRLEAVKRLGFKVIETTIVELGEHERGLAECDENLCGANLGHAERSMFTARRKVLYELLHPETEHGAIGGGHDKQSRKLCDSAPKRFTQDTAEKTDRAERTIQLDAERGEKIMPAAMNLIIDTKLDTGTFLDKVKRLPNSDQVPFVRRKLKASERKKSKPKKPKVTTAIDAAEDQLEALKRASIQLSAAVAIAPPKVRSRFFAWQNEQENLEIDVADHEHVVEILGGAS